MRAFHVYGHPIHKFEAVKQGFSWPAFFFGLFWALAKKLWGIFFVSLVIMGLAVLAEGGSESETAFSGLVSIVLMIIFGVKGNDWRKRKLVKRGFEKLDIVEAKTKDAAIAWAVKQKDESDPPISQMRRPERHYGGAGDHEERVE